MLGIHCIIFKIHTQIKTAVGHVYVPLWNKGAQIKLSVENEAFKEMSGPKISEDCGYYLRRKSVKCKYLVVDVVITNQIRPNMGGKLGQNLSVESSMEVVNCKLIKYDEIMCLWNKYYGNKLWGLEMSGSGLGICVVVVFGVYGVKFRIVLKEGHSLYNFLWYRLRNMMFYISMSISFPYLQ